MTRVKVCGITRMEDAVLAADLGAYAIGFIFWPGSARHIDVTRARAIGNEIPSGVLKVGVFVDQPLTEVAAVARDAALDVIQLHGHESLEYAQRLSRPIYKAVAVTDRFSPDSLATIPNDVTVLLDAHDPIKRGGTGKTIDWAAAAQASARRQVVLSGGITPENIRQAVAHVHPYAVDLSSGVESSPGIKDHARLRALFEQIRDE